MVHSLVPLNIDSILGNTLAKRIPLEFHENYSHEISWRRISEVFYRRGTYKFYPRKREKHIICHNYIDNFYPLIVMEQYRFFHKSWPSYMVWMNSELQEVHTNNKIYTSWTWRDRFPGYLHWRVFKMSKLTGKQLMKVGFRPVYHIFGLYGSRIIDLILEVNDYKKLAAKFIIQNCKPFYSWNNCTMNYEKWETLWDAVNAKREKIMNHIEKYNRNIKKLARR